MSAMDDTPVPAGVPPVLTLQQLIWLCGLTKERISQLATQRVIIRTDRDTYAVASIPKLFEHLRQRDAGPSKWNAARSALATEKAALARLARQEKEGELMQRHVVIGMAGAIVGAARDRFLAMSTKVAHQVAVESKPASCERIIYTQVVEILEELAALEVVAERAANGRGRKAARRACG